MKKHIPNFITVIRIILVPFLIYYFFKDIRVSIILYIIGSLTDAVDGYLSRKWNVVSELGKTLDTIADKMFSVSALMLLLFSEKLIIVTIILELTIAIINIIKKYKKLNPKTLKVGKIKTVLLCTMIISLLVSKVFSPFKYVYVLLFILTTLFQIEAVLQYKNFH